ncbi:hypothetical protein GS3922_05930 [Geobacillus subterraneus]|uniref:Uncharacterized protein n=2 Tax=Geobacillus TaxID=129337 RepID=A0ABM6AAP9_9BACL|nr:MULTISPECIES: hypothetical protein [Geobacillus]AMX83255.1 hypothetical protein GS3922_05930 [Geobacillus subterraneus]KZS25283.1 hypothetical protein A5418_04920 [Geobacillus subterraneus]OXB90245.1 hypothetical protein B9L21_05615 [Geobacillus uzenensis]
MDHIPKLDLQPFRFSPPGPMGWGWMEDGEFFDQLLLGVVEAEEEETDADVPPVLVELAGEGEWQEAAVPLPPIVEHKKETRSSAPKKEKRLKRREEASQSERSKRREEASQSERPKRQAKAARDEQSEPSEKPAAVSRPKQHEPAEQEREKPSERRMAVSFAISSARIPQPKAVGTHKKGNVFTIG